MIHISGMNKAPLVIADSDALIALANPDDAHYETAARSTAI